MLHSSMSRRPGARGVVIVLGAFLVLLGLPQVIGGAWLLALGGSGYYLPAGMALIAAGVALLRGRSIGAWIYFAFFAATAVWSWWEVGTNGWAPLPRLFGLMVLLVLVLLALPRLDPPFHSRVPAVVGVAMLVITAATFGAGIARASRVLVSAPVPVP